MEAELGCEGCRRGQHRDEADTCQFCKEGFYQEIDNTNAETAKIKACKPCEAGHYAPRIKEWSHFSEWPQFLL